MSDRTFFTVIAYDVSDDRRRRAVVWVLESFAERVQESVFEAWLDEAQQRTLQKRVRACLKESEDRLAMYVLPRIDQQAIISLGVGSVTQDFMHLIL